MRTSVFVVLAWVAMLGSVEAQPVAQVSEDSTAMPTRMTLRPLTSPQGTLSLGASLGFHRSISSQSPEAYARVPINVNAAIAIVDAFEVTITPIRHLQYTFGGEWLSRWFDPSIRLVTSFELAPKWQLGGAFTGTLPFADDFIDFLGALEVSALYRSTDISVLARAHGSASWNSGRFSQPENDYVVGISVTARAQLTHVVSVGLTVDSSLSLRSGFGGHELGGELILGGLVALAIPRQNGKTPWGDLQLRVSGPVYESDEFARPEIRFTFGATFYADLF